MNRRFLPFTLATCAVLVLLPSEALSESGVAAVENAAAALAPKNWTPPRTPDGQPDLQGIYSTAGLTPLERPPQYGSKAFFTEEEAAAFERGMIQQRNADRRDGPATADVSRAYNDLWWDWGTRVARTRQTSMVVDPPDGRIPPYTAEMQKRIDAIAKAVNERCKTEICTPA